MNERRCHFVKLLPRYLSLIYYDLQTSFRFQSYSTDLVETQTALSLNPNQICSIKARDNRNVGMSPMGRIIALISVPVKIPVSRKLKTIIMQ